MKTPKQVYDELKTTNPIKAARFLMEHRAEIYPPVTIAPEPLPEPATSHEVVAADAYRKLRATNPVAAAHLLARNEQSITNGLEALRGARPMPKASPQETPPTNEPPPQAA